MALDAKQLRELVIRPALMEIELWSEAAEELVLGTAIVESVPFASNMFQLPCMRTEGSVAPSATMLY